MYEVVPIDNAPSVPALYDWPGSGAISNTLNCFEPVLNLNVGVFGKKKEPINLPVASVVSVLGPPLNGCCVTLLYLLP